MGAKRWISHEPEPTEAQPTKARPAKPGRSTRRPRRTARRWRTKARPARRWRTKARTAGSAARTRRPARRRRTTQAGPAGRPTALRLTFHVPLPRPCAGVFFVSAAATYLHAKAAKPSIPCRLFTGRERAFADSACGLASPCRCEEREARRAARMRGGAAATAGLAGTPASIARWIAGRQRRPEDANSSCLIVCPKTSGGITKFSEHEVD